MNSSRLISALAFEHAWTLSDTELLLAHRDAPESPERTQAYRALSEKLSLAVGRHLLHVAQTRGLQAPLHADAISTPFLEAWRAARAGQPIDALLVERLGGIFVSALRMKVSIAFAKAERPDSVAPSAEAIHRLLQEKVEQGVFEPFETRNETCFVSGRLLLVGMDGWAPYLEIFEPAAAAFVPLKAGDVKAPCLQSTVVPLPSGHLLIGDWMHHPAFQAAIEPVLHDAPSLNSDLGCQARTETLARELGIGSVFVGNTCPAIVVHNGGVRIGRVSEEADLVGDIAGSVCTDMWWATMLDKQTLVDIFARSMPRKEALLEVERFLENQGHITEVQLPPGNYHLYFAGSPETFGRDFAMEEVDFQGFPEPMLALHPRPLTPRIAGTSPQRRPARPNP